MSGVIFTVGQLTRSVKTALEGTFPFVWVRGQVSNRSRPASGHVYFSLKDDEAILNAVWFKGSQKDTETFDPLTGEVFEDGPKQSLAATLENGQEIICAGKLTVYPPRGSYQLVVELAQDAGQGLLQLEFEHIKAALLAKGYFDRERKRSLPVNPTRVAVVTAVTGAAIHDFIKTGSDRGTGAEIRVYPALVQGTEAPNQIARAMRLMVEDSWAEVAVLIRGGGSLEDLWAFNTEIVAEAVFTCPVPVVAGIGHEVDVSIADMVADIRAATPTHAAQILWPERRELAQRTDELGMALTRAMVRGLTRQEEKLTSLFKALIWLSPARALIRWEERLANLEERLNRATVTILEKREQALQSAVRALPRAFAANATQKAHWLERLELRLMSLDPMGPLERGYALARNGKGAFVRSVADVTPGEKLDIILRNGSVPVRVEKTTEIAGKVS